MSEQIQDKQQQKNASTPAEERQQFPPPLAPGSENDFLAEASKDSPGFFHELFSFLMHNKKWWLAPIIIILLLFGLLLILAATGAAPFIYTLF